MKAIHMAVNAGNDTETVAAIAGAICGAFKGTASFPAEYLQFLSEVNDMDIEGIAKQTYEFLI